MIEEYFISRLEPGDVFTLAGRNLEFVMIKDMTALVRKSNSKKSHCSELAGWQNAAFCESGTHAAEKIQ